MAQARHLANAPITEAIFDFQVKARPDLRGQELEDIFPLVQDRFPNKSQAVQTRIVASTEAPTKVEDMGVTGCICKDADQLSIAQFRIDGFTFSRLQPYTSWGELFPMALELWTHYVAVAKPEFITRLAVRYINRIVLPDETLELLDYLVSAPIIPEGLPQYMNKFMTRAIIHDESISNAAHIAQIYDPSGSHGHAIILDIDAFCVKKRIETQDTEIPNIFEQLREYKNNIFFRSLTEKALEPYQ